MRIYGFWASYKSTAASRRVTTFSGVAIRVKHRISDTTCSDAFSLRSEFTVLVVRLHGRPISQLPGYQFNG